MLRAGAFDDVAAAMMVHDVASDSVGMSSPAISEGLLARPSARGRADGALSCSGARA